MEEENDLMKALKSMEPKPESDVKRKYTDLEGQLQSEIVYRLELKGCLVYMHYQNVRQGWSNPIVYTKKMEKMGFKAGVPDLMVLGIDRKINKPIRVYLECKALKGVLSKAQKEMIENLRSFGEEVRIVRRVEDIQDLLDRF